MPELPEVEVVRRGLDDWVVGRTVVSVHVIDPRSVRRHVEGPADFAASVTHTNISAAVRRGKFLWMPLEGLPTPVALVAHLGMSGQLLVEEPDAPDEKHLKVRLELSAEPGKPGELRFIDQRIFGGMHLSHLVPTGDGFPGGLGSSLPVVPEAAAHIARDILDPAATPEALYTALRKRNTQIKRAILDQQVISGVGNIYADEALWAAKLHGLRSTATINRPAVSRLHAALVDVMGRALEAGGTSFDALYVNVNGASGYFDRSLNAYGREGKECYRCAEQGLISLIRRDPFMGRSSYSCPSCQRKPR
ncbi:bifunctional DNA-formamidopyrimidine glycosylase/DNA-(apurinic or apyrimidinic site) lyase [Paeniglutamicibacter gangotriensis]|uniref:Bifunctional DNA-formamidopyrimidine glycosylase/DNA-(Apurinic or apyrimidinic site) lyase n=1 Tax=Paeniglutamicibacter gangotriensis TaxID=254787 RepID=A0A5B0EAU5_9MICC|nr:bifunctional DNA-formamidopyrimidine glycosylase/DNA-(apurinic or apyrimidinic site) lyase [Paeniglutamicibacter gangotriensis]KAA0975285.1 bifunctional DNA-formamidopyrimidine glycosylase/DNA-(apurinic or apyrimidinic site) lyase [Paeniglutamicibacter gangotriensis]